MSKILEEYLHNLAQKRNTGAATGELSYRAALENLLAAVGKLLKPEVFPVHELAEQGANHPDFGLFTKNQARRGRELRAQLPERGVVETKSTKDDAWVVSDSPQVSKYWSRYRLVLVTNYRDFLLMGEGDEQEPVRLESFRLAASEEEFWERTKDPERFAAEMGRSFEEYLRRVLSHTARLRDPKDVAWFLASYARDALSRVEQSSARPPLSTIRSALEEALGIKFKGKKGDHFFNSTFVQTLFYGLFSAWVLWARQKPEPRQPFDWRKGEWYLHIPILRALFGHLAAPIYLRPLGIDEVLDWAESALRRVDRTAFFAKFSELDALQYFYEPFLEAYDQQLRKELGVWYTPREVVEYMVARVDRALRDELGLKDGLADPRVVVLDPCTGTGSFMIEVLRRIEQTLRERGDEALVALDVKRAALTRIFGFELLLAPFVVAHLQIGLHLQAIGAPLDPDKEERAQVFLTNALTGWDKKSQTPLPLPELTEEREQSEKVKQEERILVIIGNPPYDGFAGVADDDVSQVVDKYRQAKPPVPAPRGRGLNDPYARFFRVAERRIAEVSREGIVCFISNYSWIDKPSYTGMRQHLVETFDEIDIDCLNGDKRDTGKLTPDGKPDPSIFSTPSNREGIQLGTAIALLVRKNHQGPRAARVRLAQFWGVGKLAELRELARSASKKAAVEIRPVAELGLPLHPLEVAPEYLSWPRLPAILPAMFPGVFTARDSAVTGIDREPLEERIYEYFDPGVSDEEITKKCPALMTGTRRFNAKEIRHLLVERGVEEASFVRFEYRPMDRRWLYWERETKLLDERRPEYRPHVFVKGNRWLTATPVVRRESCRTLVTSRAASLHLLERGTSLFPLFRKGDALLSSEREYNLSQTARTYAAGLGADETRPFFHIVAVLHSALYEQQNADSLRYDWPRIPLPGSRQALEHSAALGERLAVLLDVEQDVEGVTRGRVRPELRVLCVPRRDDGTQLTEADFRLTADWGRKGNGEACMPGPGRLRERSPSPREREALVTGGAALGLNEARVFELLGDTVVDVELNDRAWWACVPKRVWEYTLGGYQVLKKWLSYREEAVLGRPMRTEEVREVSHIVRRIAAILLLAPELDANYLTVRRSTWQWPEPNTSVLVGVEPGAEGEGDSDDT